MSTLFKKVFTETIFQPKLALEQCIVRNFLHILVVGTTLIAQYFGGIGVLDDLIVMFGFVYIALSIIYTALVYRFHFLSKIISITGLMADIFIVCFIMYMGDDKEAALYGLLLFIVIANGLRFGKAYMQFANIICIVGFITVISFNEFWQAHTILSIGNVIWLVLIPAHLTNLLTHLEDAVLKAETANAAKTLFIANMSHEIRTPLTSIIGFGRSLLNKTQSTVNTDNAIDAIIRNGEHLSAIVNDILDISKIEAGMLELEQREFSVIEVIRDIEFIFRKRFEDSGLDLNINYIFPLPEKILSDSLRIKQILINLCSNAIKFTELGGVTIEVRFDTNSNELLFSVKDSGIGLSVDRMDDMFSNFTQADTSITREYGGTGLGLSISAKLVKILGGKLWVESELGKGSEFYFTVEVGRGSDISLINELPEDLMESMQVEKVNINVSGKILLVDDVVDNRVLIKFLLEDMGAEVDFAENGKVALDKIVKNKYDLVLLDLQMPVMGGLEALKEIRERGEGVPVVILTANVIQNEEKESKSINCQGFLSKPIDEIKLIDVVSTYLCKYENIIKLPKKQNVLANDENIIESTLIHEISESNKYEKLAESFALQLNDRIGAIESAFKEKNGVLLDDLVHNLKGLGGNMGYEIITEISKEIEIAVVEKSDSRVEILIDKLYKTEIRILAAFNTK